MQDCSQPAPGVFVGVDIAKGKHYACALSAPRVRLCSPVRFPTTRGLSAG